MNRRSSLILSSIAIGAAVPHICRSMHTPEISHYIVPSPHLPAAFDGMRIVHLSDLHNKVFGKNNGILFRMIAEEKPDIIVMTGDMISHDNPAMEKFIDLVKRLSTIADIYYVNGNHELSDLTEEDFQHVKEEFSSCGVTCLDNSFAEIYRGEEHISICGLCYTAEYYRGVREYKRNWKPFLLGDMINFIGLKDPSEYTILLAHNPLDFDIHAEWGADLSLGGHVHGGLIRLPIVKGVLSPERRLFPKYKEGLYRIGDSYLIASRGLGRFRVHNPPEIVSVELKKVVL